jgi:carboxylate-amine ligase
LDDPRGTGADRQVAVYQQTGSLDSVIELLMQQTMLGISPGMSVVRGVD